MDDRLGEYGDIASRAALIIQSEIDKYVRQNNLDENFQEPEILVQTRGESPGTNMTPDDLAIRNQNVLNEFSSAELAAIDGIVDHFYFSPGRHSSEQPHSYGSTEHTYANLENAMAPMFDFMEIWQNATPNELSFHITEWNVNSNIEGKEDDGTGNGLDPHNYTGIRQIAPLLEMFSIHLKNGVDAMSFWSMQFKHTSLVGDRDPAANGWDWQPTVAGQFFEIMQTELIGKYVLETGWQTNGTIDLHAFGDGQEAVVFVTALQGGTHNVELDLSALFPAIDEITATKVSLLPGSTDGIFKGESGWSGFREPDAQIWQPNFTQLDTEDGIVTDGDLSFQLFSYQTVILRIDLGTLTNVQPTQGDDVVEGTHYDESTYGADGNDKLSGMGGDDTLYGELGEDTLEGGLGDDLIFGGTHDDTILGGAGADSIFGEDWADHIEGNSGADVIDGGKGWDTVFGGLGDDTIDGFWGNDFLFGNRGNDWIRGGAHHDTIMGGDGNDDLNGQWGNDVVKGDTGNDTIRGADGSDTLTGGYGADIFAFDDADGSDVITDFETAWDLIEITTSGYSFGALSIVEAGGNSTISFGTTSILVEGVVGLAAEDFVFA